MFKDQYIGRGDMWRLSRSLIGSCVHVGMEVKMLGGCIKARVKKIYGHGEPVIITAFNLYFPGFFSQTFSLFQHSC